MNVYLCRSVRPDVYPNLRLTPTHLLRAEAFGYVDHGRYRYMVIDIHYTAHGAQIETEHGVRIAA